MIEQPARQMYDVIICGAGLAGLTLARQLKLTIPELAILLIDRIKGPLAEAAFKVGESTQEVGAYYLANCLDLVDYFEAHQLGKLGLRYFFGDPQGAFQDRPEFGLSTYPPVRSYQIDRGRFENDLRRLNLAAGIDLVENGWVQEIELAEGDVPHHVIFRIGTQSQVHQVAGRWVVDAMGRRRFLQKKLRLGKDGAGRFSAAWFRCKGRIDVSDFVPSEEQAWHSRVAEHQRYFSTNHLMGPGYWVWLIALASGQTSIGIVTLEDLHPFSTYNTYERASAWLALHEPALAARLRAETPSDFLVMQRYSYSSEQVFSLNRWACVGEAGVFSDPFYSPGTDQIGLANCITTHLIRLDQQRQLTPDWLEHLNLFFLSYNEAVTRNIQSGYPFFGSALVMAAKLLWDFVSSWAFTGPLMFNLLFLERTRFEKIRKLTGKYITLSHRMQKLFATWAPQSLGRGQFEFIDYLAIPFIRDLRLRNLTPNKTEAELMADHRTSLATLEELAQALFLIALADTMPEELARLRQPVWLNAWGIGLDKSLWETQRLFQPTSPPRDLNRILDQLRVFIRFGRPVGALPEERSQTACR